MDVFLFGPISHLPLLRVVLGREVTVVPAQMPGFAVMVVGATVGLMPDEGTVSGLLLSDAVEGDLARLAFYHGVFDAGPAEMRLADGRIAWVHVARTGALPTTFAMDVWVADEGALAVATAADVMALFGHATPKAVALRYGLMAVRGASRIRAKQTADPVLRRKTGAVEVGTLRTPYAKFFAIEEYDLQFQRFDGEMSGQVNRAVFLSGDAVTVLPYDPLRDRVLLIEQFRSGPFARGDHCAWQLEAIAGRIDPYESPEAAARREALEEAGLHLGAMIKVGEYYPSPGAVAEYIYSFVAICDLPDEAAGVFGVAEEAEDIRGHLIGFDDLMQAVSRGEASNAPVLVSALWLQRERAGLRAAAGVI